jgi:hypothetical protein
LKIAQESRIRARQAPEAEEVAGTLGSDFSILSNANTVRAEDGSPPSVAQQARSRSEVIVGEAAGGRAGMP